MRASGLIAFFVLAFAITWLLDLPMILATVAHQPPSPLALAAVGLGAFGPALAALIVAARTGQLREVFGRWKTDPRWIVLGLLVTPALHLVATLIEVALGGHPQQWFYPPSRPEHVAALVFFSLGEEPGWRGFAHARLAERLGLLRGSIVLGTLWAFWHFGMWLGAGGLPSWDAVVLAVIELAAGSVVIAWLFERSGRSLAVAVALHAGGHLDNVHRAADSELRLRILRVAVFVVAAALVARRRPFTSA